MNWRDLKAGDRVRVTFEAELGAPCGELVSIYLLDGSDEKTVISQGEADAATWELLDPPLRVGSAVYRPNKRRCEVLAIHDGLAWVRYAQDGGYDIVPAAHIKNTDEPDDRSDFLNAK